MTKENCLIWGRTHDKEKLRSWDNNRQITLRFHKFGTAFSNQRVWSYLKPWREVMTSYYPDSLFGKSSKVRIYVVFIAVISRVSKFVSTFPTSRSWLEHRSLDINSLCWKLVIFRNSSYLLLALYLLVHYVSMFLYRAWFHHVFHCLSNEFFVDCLNCHGCRFYR